MIKRPSVIAALTAIGLVAIAVYLYQLPPAGIEPMGDGETVSWISLAVAVLSFLTALTGLVKKVLDLKEPARR